MTESSVGSRAGDRDVRLGTWGRIALVGLLVVGTAVATIDPLALVFFVSYAAVAAILIARRPWNAIGWILLLIAWALLSAATASEVGADTKAIIAGTATPRDQFLLWTSAWTASTAFVGYLALTLLFPTGSLPAGRWRRAAMAVLGVAVAIVVLTAFAPTIDFNPDGGISTHDVANPVAILPGLPLWSVIPTHGEQILIMVGLVFVGAGSMFVRYRRSTGVLHLQLRWLVAALVFVVLAVAFGFGVAAVLGSDGGYGWIPAVFAYPTVPLAVGVAVMRYRLLEIDRIISRTIGWALVSAVLVVVFAVGVLALQSVLERFTQGQTFAVAVSTLVAFALFQPLRRRIQSVVDRRFDRARYDGERTTAAFAGRLRDQIDLAELEADVVATVGNALRPVSTDLWIRTPSRDPAHRATP